MDAHALKNKFKAWVQAETWHTNHSLDEKRFHKALRQCFDEFGYSIKEEDFETAIGLAVDEWGSKLAADYRANKVEFFASRAEAIGSYLSDIA